MDRAAAAERYAALLPERIDILLLGVGEDGHIASLFPNSPILQETKQRVVMVVGPKAPYSRITITPSVITDAGALFVLAPGLAKSKVLIQALQHPEDFYSFPVRLALRGTWLLDKS